MIHRHIRYQRVTSFHVKIHIVISFKHASLHLFFKYFKVIRITEQNATFLTEDEKVIVNN